MHARATSGTRFSLGSATPGLGHTALRVTATPTIAPVMVCVVETGMPKKVAKNCVAAPPASAQKP
jgi:hypothetical protein